MTERRSARTGDRYDPADELTALYDEPDGMDPRTVVTVIIALAALVCVGYVFFVQIAYGDPKPPYLGPTDAEMAGVEYRISPVGQHAPALSFMVSELVGQKVKCTLVPDGFVCEEID